MSEARGEPCAAAGDTAELEHALQSGNAAAARRLSRSAVEVGEYDDALAVLAHHAPHNPTAVELLVETLDASGTVRRFAQAALLDHTAADDVSQDALISVADSVSSYSGRSKVTTWVHSIVRRRVMDHLRRQRESAPVPEDETGPAARMSSMIATRASVQQALAELDERYREPVTLRDIEGLAYAEVAARLGRAEGTVKAQISRGRAMVAAKLREDDGRDDDGWGR
ncbi:RNA polymerase sigma factor [Garicola koreensis]|uniref:RNA polymerase sigma-70 factor (ECF subfamily) n=1 Tax=Garicola koreensis TaxID=1262554 RepID=A0A7W5U1I1_9MICC|nr:RNA polymerase sigma factor [Garicola koreensis]MBB3667516.1 RNA polymerase sigma-70 factor (ECF subfamily) [Garicola koreensis]